MEGAVRGNLDVDPAPGDDAEREPARAAHPRAAATDREHFTSVYRAELAWVVSTLRRLGVAAPDLQDAAQKVFTEVWKQRASYDRDRPIKPWLFGFAYRVVGDYKRGAWRRRAVFAEVDVAHPDVVGGEEAADVERNRSLVLAALDALDLDRRAVFVLSDIDDVTAPEAAAALGIPLGTVYSRLRLAREDFAAAVKRLRYKRGER